MRKIAIGAVVLLLVLLPIFSPKYISAHYVRLLTEIFIFGLFAIGFNLLMGFAGLASFGHAIFFGTGGYVLTVVMVKLHWPLLAGVALGAAAAAALGLGLGFFGRTLKGVYLAIFTFAASQMFYQIAVSWESFLGGTDGLFGIPKPQLALARNLALDIGSHERFYYFCLAVLGASAYLIHRLLRSPFGHVLVAIRENELRTRFIGYQVDTYKMFAFLASGLFSGLAGSLYALLNRFVEPEILFWTLSGEVILMALVGGMGTLIGPIVGAGFVVALRDFLTDYTDRWLLFLGLIFVLIVIFLPKGIYPALKGLASKEKLTFD